jgi:hypothetical protein
MATRKIRQPPIVYALEQVFIDQERDLVHDTIVPVLAWVPGKGAAKKAQPFCFEVEQVLRGQRSLLTIELSWSVPALESLIPGLRDHVRRLQTSRSAQREHITELAAYGLTFVAISVLMPGRRAKAFRKGSAPDILLDLTPNALRGGGSRRACNGRPQRPPSDPRWHACNHNQAEMAGKAAALVARPDIVEVHLSLWSASPRISIMEQVKP